AHSKFDATIGQLIQRGYLSGKECRMTIIVDEHEASDAQPRRSIRCHSERTDRGARGTENIRYKKRGVAQFLCALCKSNPGRTRRSACANHTETKSSFGHKTILSFSSSLFIETRIRVHVGMIQVEFGELFCG